MSEPLDLRELDASLNGLEVDLAGRSLRDLMLDVGGIVQSKWRDNVMAAGEVDTGRYLESIEVVEEIETDRFIGVAVQTDARDEDGAPYPFFLEYGTEDIFPRPVATRAFDESRRRVVNAVSDGVDRKVRSRARKR